MDLYNARHFKRHVCNVVVNNKLIFFTIPGRPGSTIPIMWSYHGSKANIINLYPSPIHGRIIEPFAGSARYALKYWDRDITLVDRYRDLIDVWRWLQICSPADIQALPRKVKKGDRIESFEFEHPAGRLLFGFLLSKGSTEPRNQVTDWVATERPNFINFSLNRIAANLHKIKHWQIFHGSYQDVHNDRATWFIDPPYQLLGSSYKYNNASIDFEDLRNYCLSRSGQVIVCEGGGAHWLPFTELKRIKASRSGKHYTEQLYYQVDNVGREYTHKQLKLF